MTKLHCPFEHEGIQKVAQVQLLSLRFLNSSGIVLETACTKQSGEAGRLRR
jgi:hypothetical protein